MLYLKKKISHVWAKNVRARTAITPGAIHPMKIVCTLVHLCRKRACDTVYIELIINYLLYIFFKNKVPIVYAAKITENRILVLTEHSFFHA